MMYNRVGIRCFRPINLVGNPKLRLANRFLDNSAMNIDYLYTNHRAMHTL